MPDVIRHPVSFWIPASAGMTTVTLGCRYDIHYNNKILSIICHVVYATMGLTPE